MALTSGKILSAFGKLGILAVIAVAFGIGLIGTVYLSLRSPEIQVPDVVNQSYVDGETTLGKTGLGIRERAKRYKPDVRAGIILDQSPRPGEVVKAGQTIAVVVSREPKEGEKPPSEEEEKKPQDANAQKNTNEGAASENAPAKNENQNRERRGKNTNKNTNAGKNANNQNSNNGNRNTGNANTNRNSNGANANRNRNTNARPNTNANAVRNTNTGRNTNTARPGGANTNRRPGV